MRKRWLKTISVTLSMAMLLASAPVYAVEEGTEPDTAPQSAVTETVTEVQPDAAEKPVIEAQPDATEEPTDQEAVHEQTQASPDADLSAPAEEPAADTAAAASQSVALLGLAPAGGVAEIDDAYVITPETENIQAVLNQAATDGAAALLCSGEYAKGFSVKNITLYVDGTVTVQGNITLSNATLAGYHGDRTQDKLLICETDASTVSSSTLQSVTMEITGSAFNYLLHWSGGDFVLQDAALSANGNDNGCGMFVNPSTTTFTAVNSDVEFSNNIRPGGGAGIWSDSDGNINAVFHFTGGSLKLNNNGLNGYMGTRVGQAQFTFVNTDVEANGNGSEEEEFSNGDGFSYGYVTLQNTDGQVHTFSVCDNSNNGLDGGRYNNAALDADGYTILANNNGGVGLSISQLNTDTSASTLRNCTVEANGNGSYGIYLQKPLELENTIITANNNQGDGLHQSAIRVIFPTSVESLTMSADSTLTCSGNGGNGLYLYTNQAALNGTVTVEDNTGSGIYLYDGNLTAEGILTARGNGNSGVYLNAGTAALQGAGSVITGNTTSRRGGGVFNQGTLTLGEKVAVYDNTAADKGDDLYNGSQATVTFQPVSAMGTDLQLTQGGSGTITGWFYDGLNAGYSGKMADGATHRWEENVYMKRYTGSYAGVGGELALKAAYAAQTTIRPIDLEIYQGGEGYEGTTGLPEPGYTVVLPDSVNTALSGKVDLVADPRIEVHYFYNADDGTRVWHMERYAGGDSTLEDGRYVYSLYCETDPNAHPQLLITDGTNSWTSDQFPVTDAIYREYTTTITSADGTQTTGNKLTAGVQMESLDLDCDVTVETGKLEVRAVMAQEGETTFTEVADETAEPTKGIPMATTPEETEYYINDEHGMPVVAQEALPTLLYDELLTAGEGNEERQDWLLEKAEEVCTAEGYLAAAGITNPQYDFKYLDLVDAKNGNAVLTASEPVTVYMPLPEGTTANTRFVLLHYVDVDRSFPDEQLQDKIENCKVDYVPVQVEGNHVVFTTESFSPFVLIWNEGTSVTPGTSGEDSSQSTPAATPAPVVNTAAASQTAPAATVTIPQTGDESNPLLWAVLFLASGVTLGGILLYKRRMTRQ